MACIPKCLAIADIMDLEYKNSSSVLSFVLTPTVEHVPGTNVTRKMTPQPLIQLSSEK